MDILTLAGLILAPFLWFAARRADRARTARLKGRVAPTATARFAQPLPAALAVLATMGEDIAPDRTLDATVHRITPGVKLIAVVIGGACLWLIWGPSAGVFLPAGPLSWGVTALVALSVAHQFSFTARADRDRIVTETFLHWRRDGAWRDLTAIRDDGGYQYVLHFGHRRLRLPKHLVGAPELLHFIGETLERNAKPDARTSRG